jgi:serine/threonine protein kinase/peptidoglycan hydrolase-like protein with peptidoglycan-binding domain
MQTINKDDIHATIEEDQHDLNFVENSPSKRFSRVIPRQTDKELGHGAFKRVFIAFDQETGKRVAWNTIKTQSMTKREKERILEEIKLYEQLDNPYILKLIKAWRNKAKDEVVMITELMTCSLKEYLHKKAERPRLKVIKNWCKSMIKGLEYLHSRNPPVIHRDLKCENIFISSSNAEIRIGDLGLSTTLKESHLKSQVGTPYFMAPEMYDQKYGPGVDIYSFGLCVIEMCTLTTPYTECKNQISLYRKITNGEKPEAYYMIADEKIKNFISLCTKPAHLRPTAKDLLSHAFLDTSEDEKSLHDPVSLNQPILKSREIIDIKTEEISKGILNTNLIVKNIDGSKFLVNFEFNTLEEVPEKIAEELVKYIELTPDHVQVILDALEQKNTLMPIKVPEQRTPSFHGKTEDRVLKFPIKLGIQETFAIKKVMVEITFDLDKDTPEQVAEETVKQLGLDSQDYSQILGLINNKINGVDKTLQSSYSCLDLLDVEYEADYTANMVIKHGYSTTESIVSEIKSPHSFSSKNSSFDKHIRAYLSYEESFSGNLSPINSYAEFKTPPGKSDEEEALNSHKNLTLKANISRKNPCNDMKDVKLLKEALTAIMDTKIKINGAYGKKIETKVKLFQAKNNLKVDGIVTPKLWEMIMSKYYIDLYYFKKDPSN